MCRASLPSSLDFCITQRGHCRWAMRARIIGRGAEKRSPRPEQVRVLRSRVLRLAFSQREREGSHKQAVARYLMMVVLGPRRAQPRRPGVSRYGEPWQGQGHGGELQVVLVVVVVESRTPSTQVRRTERPSGGDLSSRWSGS